MATLVFRHLDGKEEVATLEVSTMQLLKCGQYNHTQVVVLAQRQEAPLGAALPPEDVYLLEEAFVIVTKFSLSRISQSRKRDLSHACVTVTLSRKKVNQCLRFSTRRSQSKHPGKEGHPHRKDTSRRDGG